MEISNFATENFDKVAAMAENVWGYEQGTDSPNVTKIFCQHLTRYNCYSFEYALQAVDEGGLQAIAFACFPGETNDAGSWLQERLPKLTEKEQHTLLTNENYLKRTDAELQSMMIQDSAKLSFFYQP